MYVHTYTEASPLVLPARGNFVFVLENSHNYKQQRLCSTCTHGYMCVFFCMYSNPWDVLYLKRSAVAARAFFLKSYIQIDTSVMLVFVARGPFFLAIEKWHRCRRWRPDVKGKSCTCR